jgi:hypothetical protein
MRAKDESVARIFVLSGQSKSLALKTQVGGTCRMQSRVLVKTPQTRKQPQVAIP